MRTCVVHLPLPFGMSITEPEPPLAERGGVFSDWDVYPTLCAKAQKIVENYNRFGDPECYREMNQKMIDVDYRFREWHSENVLPSNHPLQRKNNGLSSCVRQSLESFHR